MASDHEANMESTKDEHGSQVKDLQSELVHVCNVLEAMEEKCKVSRVDSASAYHMSVVSVTSLSVLSMVVCGSPSLHVGPHPHVGCLACIRLDWSGLWWRLSHSDSVCLCEQSLEATQINSSVLQVRTFLALVSEFLTPLLVLLVLLVFSFFSAASSSASAVL